MKESLKGISSHIQMPKSVLKRFEKDGRLYYYDIKKGILGNNGHAKSLNTEWGYYSLETEIFLRDNVETPFGEILRQSDEFDFETPSFSINSAFDETVKVFIRALLSRSPSLLPDIEKTSVFFQFLPEQQRHDLAAVVGLKLSQEQELFSDYTTTFAINKTDIPFVLPMCGAYSVGLWDSAHIVLPIAPQRAIILVSKKAQDYIMKDGMIFLFSIDDESVVQKFNGSACRTQVELEYGFVVSADKKALVDGMERAATKSAE